MKDRNPRMGLILLIIVILLLIGAPDRRLRLPVARHNRNHSNNPFDSVFAACDVRFIRSALIYRE
jgi:hypothetical protein